MSYYSLNKGEIGLTLRNFCQKKDLHVDSGGKVFNVREGISRKMVAELSATNSMKGKQ